MVLLWHCLSQWCGGKAVVGTDIPGNREWIEEGINGFLFPLRNLKVLAKKIKILVDNKKLRDEVPKINHGLVKEKVNINNLLQQFLKIYSETITSR